MTAVPIPRRVRLGRRGRSIPDQAEARAFLERLAGQPPIETQISAVFVGEDTVWKLKRPVRLSFLDFTDIEARRCFLMRELDLNAPGAPGLYRDVVPITRAGGGLTLGGDGVPIDWVLRMARVPLEDFLDVRAAAGPLDTALLDALGDMVAADHARRPSESVADPVVAMRQNVEGNARAALASGLPAADVAAWRQAALDSLERCAERVEQREAAGLVRRAHGDLHLGNICLWQGRPAPFDALEFDERMATIDLGYDLAFLLMDLDRRSGRAAANRVLNRYVARTGDAGLVGLLPLFLSRRAMVRAHVAGGTEGLGYLAAALRHIQPPPGCVVAIGGLPGAGKSTLARALAPALGPAPGALIVRSDELRKRLHGVAPEQRLPPEAYSAEANRRVEAALLEAIRQAEGHAVIADATFLDVGLRRAVAEIGRPFVGIWLEAPLDELERRVATRSGDASDATPDVLRRMASRGPGAGDWHRVRADSEVLARSFSIINQMQ
jgi:aminoglycoside phosphotransferase family enzyme/predicted kinase